MDDDEKIMIGEIKGRLDLMCQKIDKIDNSINNLDKRIREVEKFNSKITGIAIAISFIVSLTISIISTHLR